VNEKRERMTQFLLSRDESYFEASKRVGLFSVILSEEQKTLEYIGLVHSKYMYNIVKEINQLIMGVNVKLSLCLTN
jgi:hypothetical protein